MVYEALSSGAAVSLLEVPKKKKTRISSALDVLVREKKLTTFSLWHTAKTANHSSFKFNEAERCAALLLEKGMLN